MLSTTTGTAPASHTIVQVALEAPRVEVLGQRGDEEDRVDVRRDDLLLHRAPRRSARDGAAPLEADVNDAVDNSDPVADRGKIGGAGGVVAEPAADLGPALRVAGDAIQATLFLDDAGKLQVAALEPADLILKKRTPAKAFALV